MHLEKYSVVLNLIIFSYFQLNLDKICELSESLVNGFFSE